MKNRSILIAFSIVGGIVALVIVSLLAEPSIRGVIIGLISNKSSEQFKGETQEINKNIEIKVNIFPSHIQSGHVSIGKIGDYSTYKFGTIETREKFLEANGAHASGIYRFDNKYWRKVLLSDLKNEDYVVITYYSTPARSDSGKKGKTIVGIISDIRSQNDGIFIKLINDSTNQEFLIIDGLNIRTEDEIGLYKFPINLRDGISKGLPVRLSSDDKGRVVTLTLLAPRTNIIQGIISKIDKSIDNEVMIKIQENDQYFFFTNNTNLVRRGSPDNLENFSSLKEGQHIYMTFYNLLSEYIVLSADFQ